MENRWQIHKWHCPNCGEMVYGTEGKDGSVKTVCPKCGTAMKMVEKGRRHDVLNLYPPDGTEKLSSQSVVFIGSIAT